MLFCACCSQFLLYLYTTFDYDYFLDLMLSFISLYLAIHTFILSPSSEVEKANIKVGGPDL